MYASCKNMGRQLSFSTWLFHPVISKGHKLPKQTAQGREVVKGECVPSPSRVSTAEQVRDSRPSGQAAPGSARLGATLASSPPPHAARRDAPHLSCLLLTAQHTCSLLGSPSLCFFRSCVSFSFIKCKAAAHCFFTFSH